MGSRVRYLYHVHDHRHVWQSPACAIVLPVTLDLKTLSPRSRSPHRQANGNAEPAAIEDTQHHAEQPSSAPERKALPAAGGKCLITA